MLGYLPMNVSCHIRASAPAAVEASFCTPEDNRAVEIFTSLKRLINGAANKMAVPHQIDATNPNLDEDTFRLAILVARSLTEHLTEQNRLAELPVMMQLLAVAEAGKSPDEFQLLADNLEPILGEFQDVSNGKYGQRVRMTPTVYKPPTLRPGGLILVAGAGLLGGALIYLLTPTVTKGAL